MNDDQPTLNYDNIGTWDVLALKNFLRQRNLPISGTKPMLVARVFAAQEQCIAVHPSKQQLDEIRESEYRKILTTHEGILPDPFHDLPTGWLSETNGIMHWPSTSMRYISNYLRKHEGVLQKVSLSKRLLSDYKDQKAYSYFTSGFLSDILYHPVSETSEYCFLKCKCQPSQRIRDLPHELWVLIHKPTGDIEAAYCTCFAGLGQSCNHIAALLFRIEYALENGETGVSCTSKPCTWTSTRKAIEPILVSDMRIVKPSAIRCNLKRISTLNSARKKLFAEHNPNRGISEEEFLSKLELFSPKSVTLAERTPGRRSVHLEYDKAFEALQSAKLPPTVTELGEKCKTVDELENALFSMELTDEDVSNIEIATRLQGGKIWKSQRSGRLTASKFHRIYTRMKSYQNDKSIDMTAVIADALDYKTPPSQIKELQYGRKMENIACEAFESMLKNSGHTDVKVEKCGLFVSKSAPYIGASPDRLVTCLCCGRRVLEVKCPASCATAVPSESTVEYLVYRDGKCKLNRNSKYFTQVLGQMAVADVTRCDFFVYSGEGYHHEVIEFDESLWMPISIMLTLFFLTFIVPELLSSSVKQAIQMTKVYAASATKHETDVRLPKKATRRYTKRVKTLSKVSTPVYLCGVCGTKCEDVPKGETDIAKFSISCDACRKWYHWPCVGIKSDADDTLKRDTFVCFICLMKQHINV